MEDISEENLDDVFKICGYAYKISPGNKEDTALHEEAVEARRRWLVDMMARHGPCAKIAYLDEKPVAQILFCPEEAISFIRDPRRDVVSILCIYSPFPETQRRGAATALVKDLVEECSSGLHSLDQRPCRFIVTQPFPTMGRSSCTALYKSCGFGQGHKEMFLEVSDGYEARERPDYRALPGDLGKTSIFYNPACEWGHFYAVTAERILQGIDPDHPVEVHSTWGSPEEFIRRSIQRVTAGRTIVNGQRIPGGVFWTDRDAFIQEVREALRIEEG